MADADRIAAALRYQQDQAMPSPLAAAIQSPEYIGGALRDPQFYGDIGRRLSGLLKGGLQDILPTGAGPIMAKQGYEADPNYMQKINDVGLAGMTVFHGSPYKFDKFDMGKIGTGEGAQAYGHGLYFAENPKVANEYAEKLTNPEVLFGGKKLNEINDPMTAKTAKWISDNVGVMQTNARTAEAKRLFSRLPMEQQKALGIPEITTTGNLYKVDLPDEHIAKMLDWDKPLSQQSKAVQKAVQSSEHPMVKYWASKSAENPAYNGADLYLRMAGEKGDKVAAAAALREAGIPGIRYLDGGSRTGGAGTSNFVVFDDALPKIIGRE